MFSVRDVAICIAQLPALIFCKLPTVRPASSTRSASSSEGEEADSSEGETEEKRDTVANR